MLTLPADTMVRKSTESDRISDILEPCVNFPQDQTAYLPNSEFATWQEYFQNLDLVGLTQLSAVEVTQVNFLADMWQAHKIL